MPLYFPHQILFIQLFWHDYCFSFCLFSTARLSWNDFSLHHFFYMTFLAKIKGISPGNDCGNKMVDSVLGGKISDTEIAFLGTVVYKGVRFETESVLDIKTNYKYIWLNDHKLQ